MDDPSKIYLYIRYSDETQKNMAVELSDLLKQLYLEVGGTIPPHDSPENYFSWFNKERYDFEAAIPMLIEKLTPIYTKFFETGFVRTANDKEYLMHNTLPVNWWTIGEKEVKLIMQGLGEKDPQSYLESIRKEVSMLAKQKAKDNIKASEKHIKFTVPVLGLYSQGYNNTGIDGSPFFLDGNLNVNLSINEDTIRYSRQPSRFRIDFSPFIYPKPISEGKGKGEIWSYFGNYHEGEYYRDIEGNWSDLGYIKIDGDGGAVFFPKVRAEYRNLMSEEHIYPLYSFWITGGHWSTPSFGHIYGLNEIKFNPFTLFEDDLSVFFRHTGYDSIVR